MSIPTLSFSRLPRITDLMRRYIESGKLAGTIACIAHRGQTIFLDVQGYQNLENQTLMTEDSIFRIYSMTKPITSVALMMLFEESRFTLTDPVSQYIPAFKDAKVLNADGKLEVPRRPMTIQDLLRHTAGLSYGNYVDTHIPVDKLYDEHAGIFSKKNTNAELVKVLATLPLAFHPGEKWHYSMATDVCGYLVEVLSDMSLAEFMQAKIFNPLGMRDTSFEISPSKLNRLCTLYGKTADSSFGVLDLPETSKYIVPVNLHAGGSGLLSTTGDYLKFAQCVLNKGELNAVRLLGRKTVELMTMNHLPLKLLPIAFEGSVPLMGMGFGLGFSVSVDIAQCAVPGSVGEHGWGGYAETYFWIDSQEELIALLMIQYLPSQTYPIRKEFKAVVLQALI